LTEYVNPDHSPSLSIVSFYCHEQTALHEGHTNKQQKLIHEQPAALVGTLNSA